MRGKNTLKTIAHRFLFFLSVTLLAGGCLEEKVSILPKAAHVTLQGNNFNQTREGLLVDGSAPDMYYFKQNDDGTYTVMLTSNRTQSGNVYQDIFETKWDTEYVTFELNAKGAIIDSLTREFPFISYFPANFGLVYEINSSDYYAGRSEPIIISENSITYLSRLLFDCCRFDVFTLDFFGNSKRLAHFETTDGESRPLGIFKTRNGSNIVISYKVVYASDFYTTINYSILTNNGDPIYNHDLEFPQVQPGEHIEYFYHTYYLTERSGDHFFFNHHNGGFNGTMQWTYDNVSTFLDGPSYNEGNFTPTKFNVEIRFGPGKTQKAHRLDDQFLYANYVDVPFEVWDISNNRQLMVSFWDRYNDGVFELTTDINESDSFVIHDLPYSIEPKTDIIDVVGFFYGFYRLVEGVIWDPATFPDATIRVIVPPPNEPGGKLVKLNEQGVSVVNNNLLSPSAPIKNIYKIVPHGNGFAVLCNAPQPIPYQPAQLFLLDENFKQTAVFNMSDIAPDNTHRLESNGNVVFYTSILNSPGESRLALRLSKIENGVRTDKILNEFISFQIESYQITPTQNGGLALLAWVRPDKDTRDLLFIEFDENLNLIER